MLAYHTHQKNLTITYTRNNTDVLQTVNKLNSQPGDDAKIFNERFSLIKRLYSDLESNFPENIQLFDGNVIFSQTFSRSQILIVTTLIPECHHLAMQYVNHNSSDCQKI
ncbi:hypothetical protein MNBD_GAMMA21-661 [hydrothermal vent metagenome]|uniref:Uncharacterized protein n=1 Tax=hydrothermal vent metagenome TaxID=652676 RepID=A0A3B1B210_9ZZZZ